MSLSLVYQKFTITRLQSYEAGHNSMRKTQIKNSNRVIKRAINHRSVVARQIERTVEIKKSKSQPDLFFHLQWAKFGRPVHGSAMKTLIKYVSRATKQTNPVISLCKWTFRGLYVSLLIIEKTNATNPTTVELFPLAACPWHLNKRAGVSIR